MNLKKFGKKLKLSRIKLELNQTELARKIGSNQKSVSRYETGTSLPSLRTFIKIVKMFDEPTDYYLNDLIKGNGKK